MKNTSMPNDRDANSEAGQSNEAESGNRDFLGGIGDALSGIFNTGERSTQPAPPQGGIMGGINDAVSGIFDTADKATKPAPPQGGIVGGVDDAMSGVFDTAERVTDSASSSAGGGSDAGSWPNQSGSGSASASASDTGYTTDMSADTSTSGGGEEEPFEGSGGVGSAEFYENLRRGHEAAGGEYASDLEDPNRRGEA